MFLNAFQDMVSEVRLSTTKILREILQVVGSDYILESILPKLTKIYESSIIYQERVNVFHALSVLAFILYRKSNLSSCSNLHVTKVRLRF
jgi:hypothetical protein